MKIKFDEIILLLFFFLFADFCTQGQGNSTDWGVHPMDYSRIGTAGWQFLKLPTNARNAAVGGIISVISSGDANSVFTNPASLSNLQGFEISFSNMKWVADISYQSFSIIRNFNEYGTLGLGLVYLDYGSMVRTENILRYDALGNSLGVLPVLDGLGTFSASDFSLGLSYAKQITNKLQIGGTLKYLQERLDDAKTSNWSVDIATLYYTGFNSLRISFVGQNFGPDATFASYTERIQVEPVKVKMPMVLAMGIGYDFLEGKNDNPNKLATMLEYKKPNDGDDKIVVGLEYSYLNTFYIRGGYKFNYDVEDLTLGAGVHYDYNNEIKFKIDYAFINVGIFNQVHMFSFGISF